MATPRRQQPALVWFLIHAHFILLLLFVVASALQPQAVDATSSSNNNKAEEEQSQQSCAAAAVDHNNDPNRQCQNKAGAAAGTAAESVAAKAQTTSPAILECGLYLAESTLPHAGLGIFAGKEYSPGEVIGNGELCLPYYDIYWHNGANVFPNPFRDYFWSGSVMGMTQETNTDDIEAICFGMDAAANCHPGLSNVERLIPHYDTADVHRSQAPHHVGVGAFTPYWNGTSQAARRVPAGSEVFKNYGEQWFHYRTPQYFDTVFPLWENYGEAQTLLQSLRTITTTLVKDDNDKHSNSNNKSHTNIHTALFRDIYQIILDTFKHCPHWNSRTINAFPDDFTLAIAALNDDDYHGDIGAAVTQPRAMRSLTWLQEHGRCQDHIRPGRRSSVFPQAGHGAFASRSLPAGTVITTSPLHHVPNRSFANLYSFYQTEGNENGSSGNGGEWRANHSNIIGHQLFLNYCYSHPQSTVLLCPYGAGVNSINHHFDNTKVNVRIQWAVDFPIGHNHSIIVHGTVEDLAATERPIIAWDYVAIRDIAQGEELFLDYGIDWTTAWEEHVAIFPPLTGPNAPHYQPARLWNTMFSGSILRTEEEQAYDPYPHHLEIRCHHWLEIAVDAYEWEFDHVGKPCRILERHGVHTDEYLYTVQIIESSSSSSEDGMGMVLSDVPRQSVAFVDVPLTTDLRLPGVFRHWIGIPDDIFPPQWKNLMD